MEAAQKTVYGSIPCGDDSIEVQLVVELQRGSNGDIEIQSVRIQNIRIGGVTLDAGVLGEKIEFINTILVDQVGSWRGGAE